MKLLRVAAASLNQTPLDFVGNTRRILAQLARAKETGVELLVLPELCVTGYGCEDAFFSLETVRQAEKALQDILPMTGGMTVVLGLPHIYAGSLYNCVAMIQDTRVLGLSAKRALPREGVHYEPRWFKPWPFGEAYTTQLVGSEVPFGDLRYRLGELGVAIEICEEAWGASPLAAHDADRVALVVNPSASHFALGKYERREHLVANASRALQVVYVYANLVGLEAGRIIYDGGCLIAAGGHISARGKRFGFGDGDLCIFDADVEAPDVAKIRSTAVRAPAERRPPLFEVRGLDPRRGSKSQAAQNLATILAADCGGKVYVPFTRNEEFLEAEILGLFDYLRKSGAKGFVLPLSGGCDSACCAVLVAHMCVAAVQELGLAEFSRRLAIKQTNDAHAVTRELLTCVYEATRNSSATTRQAAQALAEALGAQFHALDVQPAVNQFVQLTESALGRKLVWEKDDVTLQNIQARARAPLVWALANAKGKLLLTTSNRSEASVGYATMDGDMAGGLAPLAGIDKAFLRQWLVWAEKHCARGLGPIPALAKVNDQAPTAELRPTEQRDEDDLMPYEVLGRIERYFVLGRLGEEDIADALRRDFPEYPDQVLTNYVQKFLRLWTQSQWKRERTAPSFHLDELSVDPKTWFRFPILSGLGKGR